MIKQVGKMLFGAVAGFVLMYVLLGFQLDVNIAFMPFEWMMMFMVLSILLLVFSLFGYTNIRAEAKKALSGEEEDKRDERQSKRYSDITLATNIAMYFSLAMLALVAVTPQHNVFIFISLALILISFTCNMMYSELLKMIHPHRSFPSVNDKHYAKKLMEMSDEGERHVMLQGIYKAFTSINSLLFFAVLALIGYSVISGVSQLFGIFCIITILIIINAQYMLNIRNK